MNPPLAMDADGLGPRPVDLATFRTWRASVLGARIEAVRYLMFDEGLATERDRRADAHELDFGLVLGLEAAREIGLAWTTPGRTHGLDLRTGRAPLDMGFTACRVVDATRFDEWAPFLDRPVSGVEAAVEDFETEPRPLVHSVRFTVEGNRTFVVALGDLENGSPRWFPTALVVLFADPLGLPDGSPFLT